MCVCVFVCVCACVCVCVCVRERERGEYGKPERWSDRERIERQRVIYGEVEGERTE